MLLHVFISVMINAQANIKVLLMCNFKFNAYIYQLSILNCQLPMSYSVDCNSLKALPMFLMMSLAIRACCPDFRTALSPAAP